MRYQSRRSSSSTGESIAKRSLRPLPCSTLIDVGHLEGYDLGDAQSGAVGGAQRGLVLGPGAAFEPSPDRSVTTMTIDDVEHFTAEEKAKIIASYPAHEREARTKGIPTLGSGRIFPVPEERLAIEQRDFPNHWPRIGGMDFGWDHPFAAVELIWDRDTDCVYVSRTYRCRESTPIMHAAALRPWGKDLRWAWPRDGRRETLEGAGVSLARQYTEQGLDMLHEHSQFEDGSVVSRPA